MTAVIPKIRVALNYPTGCRERILPLRHPAAAQLTRVGVGRAGVSELVRGHAIAHPEPLTHWLLITEAGEGYFDADRQRHRLTPGTIAIAPAGVPRRYGTQSPSWRLLWFNLADRRRWQFVHEGGPRVVQTAIAPRLSLAMEGLLAECGAARPARLPPPPMPAPPDSARAHFAARMPDRIGWAYESEADDSAGPAAQTPAFHYGAIIRAYLAEVLSTTPRDDAQQTLERMWAAVRRDLQRPWSVEQLASEAGMSRATLHRMNTRHYGRSPGALLSELRMAQARELLRHTDYPLKVIAERLGYAHAFALSTAFKRSTGRSPRVYRREG